MIQHIKKVLSVGNGLDTMYKIIECETYGLNSYTVNSHHILSLIKYTHDGVNSYEKVDMDIQEYLNLSIEEKDLYYGYRRVVLFPSNNININKNKLFKYVKKTGILTHDFVVNTLEIRAIVLSALIEKYNILFKPAHDFNEKTQYRMLVPRKKDYVERLMFLIRSLGISVYAKKIDIGDKYSLRLWGKKS